MSSLGKKVILGFVFVSLALLSCETGPIVKTNHVEGELRGMVYDLDRQPMADALVSLEGSAAVPSALTDLHGRFGLGIVKFGQVRLKVEKAGYEPLSWDFRFAEGSQVLYLQMASTDQLFEKAASALEKKAWLDFQGFLDRAKALSPNNLQAVMLEATALEQRNQVKKAIALLEGYRSDRPIFAIEVLLGDLYSAQGEKANALVHWKRALEIRENPAVRAKVDRA